MSGSMVEFRANGRMANGWLERHGTGPGLIVIQEWWGLVDHIKDVAARFAREGFVVLAPDLYHGEKTTHPDDAGRMLMALDIERTGKELRGAADYLLSLDSVSPKKVAALGFCMGGQLALYAACQSPDRVCAAVDFYGIHPKVDPDVTRLSGPVLGHFGKTDGFVKEADARALESKIRGAGKSAEFHFYDAGHAFFNDTRSDAYHGPSASLALERTLAFLRSQLSG
ncbi:MAG: alpha/beta fold hydrolase [Deltaproteobacteria bacterium]|nr:alpha/beta fold hydrolase [Deltaproteobacteria bacterium]